MTKKKIIIISVIAVLVILIAIISNFVDPTLNGMDITILGDSIMEGYGNGNNGFEHYFSGPLFESKINNIKGYPRIILLDGGANDIMGYNIGTYPYANQKPIGKVDTENKGVTEGDTVIHHFEDTIRILKEKYPLAKICYIQMFLIDDDTINHITVNEAIKPELKQRRDDLWKEIKIACKKWNIDYIDVSNKFLDTDIKYRQEDWIHINDDGYKYITPFLLKELDKLY